MSIPKEREILLSQLVDGELPADQANQVLAEVFDELGDSLESSETGSTLNAMLRLRRVLNPWRQLEPEKTIVVLPSPQPADKASPFGSQVMCLAAAAMLGGILVAGGFLLGGRSGGERSAALTADRSKVIPTPEQRSEITRAFSLHESVAGPLSWYAADDSTIQVAPAATESEMQPPIAVILTLTRDPACPSREAIPPKTYMIVCRNSDTAAIEFPPSAMAAGLRLRLFPTETNGRVNLRYVLAAGGLERGLEDAALAGRRHVGFDQTSLGQLALDDCMVSVDASAWVIGDRNKP